MAHECGNQTLPSEPSTGTICHTGLDEPDSIHQPYLREGDKRTRSVSLRGVEEAQNISSERSRSILKDFHDYCKETLGVYSYTDAVPLEDAQGSASHPEYVVSCEDASNCSLDSNSNYEDCGHYTGEFHSLDDFILQEVEGHRGDEQLNDQDLLSEAAFYDETLEAHMYTRFPDQSLSLEKLSDDIQTASSDQTDIKYAEKRRLLKDWFAGNTAADQIGVSELRKKPLHWDCCYCNPSTRNLWVKDVYRHLRASGDLISAAALWLTVERLHDSSTHLGNPANMDYSEDSHEAWRLFGWTFLFCSSATSLYKSRDRANDKWQPHFLLSGAFVSVLISGFVDSTIPEACLQIFPPGIAAALMLSWVMHGVVNFWSNRKAKISWGISGHRVEEKRGSGLPV